MTAARSQLSSWCLVLAADSAAVAAAAASLLLPPPPLAMSDPKCPWEAKLVAWILQLKATAQPGSLWHAYCAALPAAEETLTFFCYSPQQAEQLQFSTWKVSGVVTVVAMVHDCTAGQQQLSVCMDGHTAQLAPLLFNLQRVPVCKCRHVQTVRAVVEGK